MNVTQSAGMEMQEYLFANTSAEFAIRCEKEKVNVADIDKARDHVREMLRFHRFTVINWLMVNGVKIPVELLSDQTHPGVGFQTPDQPV